MRSLRLKCLGWIAAMGVVTGASAALAQETDGARPDDAPALVEFGDFQIRPLGPSDRVKVEERDGQPALTITRTGVALEGIEFGEGVIEFDLAFDRTRGFGGLMWHVSETNDGEYFYIRKHKSGLPDAGQYTPVRQGLTSWQIFNDVNAMAPFAFTHEGWNRIKFVIADDKADIYFNGNPDPVLHVPDLASDRGTGGVGFRTSGPSGEITIANLTIRDLAPGEGIVGVAKEVAPPPPGVIASWLVSDRFAESRIEGALTMPADLPQIPSAGTLMAEPNGIVDIGRLGRPNDDADTRLASVRINSDAARKVRLRFGYSDRIRLFLNGELVFDGSAGFRARDFFFLGSVGFEDAVMLDLREGENDLQAVVSETFGGWAIAGAIENDEGLTIRP